MGRQTPPPKTRAFVPASFIIPYPPQGFPIPVTLDRCVSQGNLVVHAELDVQRKSHGYRPGSWGALRVFTDAAL